LLLNVSLINLAIKLCDPYTVALHCNPGEAYMLLITASCEAGPGSTHMCTFEIFIWRILILEFADRCYFQNSTFDLSKLHLYFKIVKLLMLSYQGLNLHPMRISEFALNLKVSPARIEPRIFWLGSSSLDICLFTRQNRQTNTHKRGPG
jgi:hypothetical protein